MPFSFTMPKLSPTMEEGVIAKWYKKEGEFVKDGELLLEVATDKATLEHAALDGGWLRKILVKEGESAKVNEAIAILSSDQNESIEGFATKAPPQEIKEEKLPPLPAKIEEAPSPPIMPHEKKEGGRLIASPLAKKIAKEKGIDLSSVQGSGPGGRIVMRDLEKATFFGGTAPTIPSGTYEELPLTPIRKVIAKRLQESKSSIPHYYLTRKIHAMALYAMREQLKSVGVTITFNDMIIRACAIALQKHPEINAGFNSVNSTIISFKTIDISVAVSIESGLITPIVRHADFKNLKEISFEVKALVTKAKEGKLKEEEYRGGSFCVSNLGMFGIDAFCAVINPPQAAILAVGAILDEPILQEGQVIAGKTLTLTLSADHRIIDGAPAAQFLQTLQQLLENPASLLI